MSQILIKKLMNRLKYHWFQDWRTHGRMVKHELKGLFRVKLKFSKSLQNLVADYQNTSLILQVVSFFKHHVAVLRGSVSELNTFTYCTKTIDKTSHY